MISFYHNELLEIDKKILEVEVGEIPQIFAPIPLDVFGYLYLLHGNEYPNIKLFLPTMASKEVQLAWTGASDKTLLLQSLSFVKSVVNFAEKMGISDLHNVSLLDFGCGWGRILRLFLKYIPESRLFGVDPMNESLEQCILHKVKGNLMKSDYLCRSLPFGEMKFDIVIAMSVFTHLSRRAMDEALRTIRSRVSDNALFVVTVRPTEYWEIHKQHADSNLDVEGCEKEHNTKGFVFRPHAGVPPIEGDVTFGDTSMTLEFISENWHGWKVVGTDVSLLDSMQIIIFLKPC